MCNKIHQLIFHINSKVQFLQRVLSRWVNYKQHKCPSVPLSHLEIASTGLQSKRNQYHCKCFAYGNYRFCLCSKSSLRSSVFLNKFYYRFYLEKFRIFELILSQNYSYERIKFQYFLVYFGAFNIFQL